MSEPGLRIERRPARSRLPAREGWRPGWIVVHTTDGPAESTCAWFDDPRSGVSAHYLVRLDGGVVQFVDEEDGARHAGGGPRELASKFPTADPNLHTIGIEFEDGGEPLEVDRPAAQYRAGARLIAEAAARWEIPLGRDRVLAHRELNPRKACPGNLDLERLLREARTAIARPPAAGPLLLALLPARNSADDLAGWLESAGRFADAAVALDDGSTDETAEMLEASPLVAKLLRNPVREGYAGWDDAANRQRLLDAALELSPAWVLFLDADERIDAEDGAALREFLGSGDALPGCAYGIRLHRCWGEDGLVAGHTVGYRVFSPRPGQRLPPRRLHFNPVPEDIPRSAWLRTTVRARHLDSPERMAARLRKYAEADPAGELERETPRLLDEPGEPLERWRPREPGLAVLDLGAAVPSSPRPPAGGPLLLALLPARNSADDLAGWLESAGRFADAAVALDDGSTDETARILEASPLVAKLLRNPVREGYAGWDDAANRQRLLDAALELSPAWVLFLDADERIDAEDGAALREFLGTADPRSAYGFRVFRMVGDESRYDQAGLWVYRLFSPASGARLPQDRLHFVPVPGAIPRERWRKTTIRIQHLASLDEERRRRRYAKYIDADPERRYQLDYSNLLAAGVETRPWVRRPPGLPPLADPLGRGARREIDLHELDPGAPALSAIVISRDDEDRIERSVASVVGQQCDEPFEVIVVVSGTDRTGEIVRDRFPGVKLVVLPRPALPGEARNAGVAVARGDIVSFPGSHVELPPGSLAARIRAHSLGYPMVTGTVVNGTETRAGWASYFLDHSNVLPGRPSTELAGPPSHCSYLRELVLEAGGFPEGMRTGEDTVVNKALWQRGLKAYRAADVRLVHNSPCTDAPALLRHHFRRGRGLGRIVCAEHREGRPLLRPSMLRGLGLRYIPGRLRRIRRAVARWGEDVRPQYLRSRPLIAAGAVAAWAGTWCEILRPQRGKLGVLIRDGRGEDGGLS